ncbi:MAG: hypothetical protein CVV44_08575 [Spirochaetae bacterium HGW-Spirochaetae-1]|jgi:AcrR family transcriptional regulator|nr:MAG: hypothetical protein CVV44_08575 [Spirochaetae bacterium HGW-Spirochaetae-1]
MKETFLKLAEDKRLFILNAAAEIFARDGYHQAGISEICKNAGISNGALYKYFSNKEALFLTILDFGIDMVRGLYRQFPATGSVPETLNKIFTGIRTMAQQKGFVISIYLDLGTCAMNRFAQEKSDELERVGRDFLTELLENARSRGEIPTTVDIASAVYFIDNLIILYSYSMVSEHHRRRLLVFMNEKNDVSDKKKIEFMLQNLKDILRLKEK